MAAENRLNPRILPCFAKNPSIIHPLAPLRLALLEHLLDNLLLLNQESTGDAVTDAVATSRTTVCALDSLLGARETCVLARPLGGDLLNVACQRLAVSINRSCLILFAFLHPVLPAQSRIRPINIGRFCSLRNIPPSFLTQSFTP